MLEILSKGGEIGMHPYLSMCIYFFSKWTEKVKMLNSKHFSSSGSMLKFLRR